MPSAISNFPTQQDGEFTPSSQYPGSQGSTSSFPNARPGFTQSQPGIGQFPTSASAISPSGFPSTGSTAFQPSGPSGQSVSSNTQFPTNQRPPQSGGVQRPVDTGFTRPEINQPSDNSDRNDGKYDGGDYSAIPGSPGTDYPIYSEIPETSFDCLNQEYPGYYADVEAQCQVFHICALNRTFNFLCPNGTIFSQQYLVCVWWNQFDCNSAPSLFSNNANIYDYSQTGNPQNNLQDQQPQYPGAPQTVAAPTQGISQPAFGSAGRPQQPLRPTSSSFPVSPAASIGQSGNYPSGSAGPTPSYPITSPTGIYPPANQGSIGQPATTYPTGVSYTPSAVASPNYPVSLVPNVGYPVAPSGPGFPPSGQNDVGSFSPTSPQTPTREYLPPRIG